MMFMTHEAKHPGRLVETVTAEPEERLYIWLDGQAGNAEPDAIVEDVPGVSDLELVAEAVLSGHLGRYLPATIHFATHPDPNPGKVRSIDTARLLRDRSVPHRRRYEILTPTRDETDQV